MNKLNNISTYIDLYQGYPEKSLKISHPKKIFLFCNNIKYIEMEMTTPTKNRLCYVLKHLDPHQSAPVGAIALGPHGFLYTYIEH